SAKAGLASANHVGGHPALAIGRACQRNDGWLSGDHIIYFHSVSDSPNLRIGGAHLSIHSNPSPLADLQTGGFGEGSFWPDANRQDGKVRFMSCAAFRDDADAT